MAFTFTRNLKTMAVTRIFRQHPSQTLNRLLSTLSSKTKFMTTPPQITPFPVRPSLSLTDCHSLTLSLSSTRFTTIRCLVKRPGLDSPANSSGGNCSDREIPTLFPGCLNPRGHSLTLSLSSTRFTTIRCLVKRPGPDSPANSSGSNFSDREIPKLFPGCDFKHWLVLMRKPGGKKQHMIATYIKTLAKVLGSEKEAGEKIYSVSCERYFGFGCQVDEETAEKMKGLPGVLDVIPDSYMDAENQDYGGELFRNGKIVERHWKAETRVQPAALRNQDRPTLIKGGGKNMR